MAGRKKWKFDLLGGQAAAEWLLAGSFCAGSVLGCVAAGWFRDPGGELSDHVYAYLAAATEKLFVPGYFAAFWQTVRLPLMVAVLGFSALGVLGIPVLFLFKGFALCYAVSVFYRLLGPEGIVPAVILFGMSAFVWLPVLLRLGGRGLVGSYGLLRRAAGDGKFPMGYNGGFLVCCGICAAALCLCAGMECLVVPRLLQKVVGLCLPG